MKQLPFPASARAAIRGTSPSVSTNLLNHRHQLPVPGASRLSWPHVPSSRLARLPGLAHLLVIGLIVFAFGTSTRAQSSVTLAWDADTSGTIASYRLYNGVASGTYTNVITLGFVTTNTVTGLTSGVTYFFAVTAVGTNGLESAYSSELSYTVPLPPNGPPAISLISPANGSAYDAPATIPLVASANANGHTITQVQFYNGATLLGTAAVAPYTWSWNNVSAGTYSLSVTAVYDSGITVASASANVVVAAARPALGLTFAADSGTLTSPFVGSNGTLSQSVETDLTNGGQAVYTFYISNAGDYLVSAMVIAPSEGQNSLYVNIDSPPTDPLMIWDIPVCSTLTNATVSWRGNGNSDPATSQFAPKVFSLAAGQHQLIIVGRGANATLGTITIASATPVLNILCMPAAVPNVPGTSAPPATLATLKANGVPGQTYNVLASQDLVTWTILSTMTLDGTGSGVFTDPAGATYPHRYYRLQGQ